LLRRSKAGDLGAMKKVGLLKHPYLFNNEEDVNIVKIMVQNWQLLYSLKMI